MVVCVTVPFASGDCRLSIFQTVFSLKRLNVHERAEGRQSTKLWVLFKGSLRCSSSTQSVRNLEDLSLTQTEKAWRLCYCTHSRASSPSIVIYNFPLFLHSIHTYIHIFHKFCFSLPLAEREREKERAIYPFYTSPNFHSASLLYEIIVPTHTKHHWTLFARIYYAPLTCLWMEHQKCTETHASASSQAESFLQCTLLDLISQVNYVVLLVCFTFIQTNK